MLVPHVVALCHDLALPGVAVLSYAAVCRAAPARWSPTLRTVALVCLFGLGLLLASYPRFLREYLASTWVADHVLLIVMEGVMAAHFESEFRVHAAALRRPQPRLQAGVSLHRYPIH